MTKEEFSVIEVKPKDAGWYYVTMFQYEKLDPKHPDYIKDWLEFDGTTWDYALYYECCYVCFIYKKELEN